MKCPSCWEDLTRFEFIYRFCPLCSARLPDDVIAGTRDKERETVIREASLDPSLEVCFIERSADPEPEPPFRVYRKDDYYAAGTGNTLEFDLVPTEELWNLSAAVRLVSLDLTAERDVLPHVRKNVILRFYFLPEIPGRHLAELRIVSHDSKGNPTVFDTDDFVFIVEAAEELQPHTTFNIGDIITPREVTLGYDRRTLNAEQKNRPAIELGVVYNDAETRRFRTELLVKRIAKEAKRFYEEGRNLIDLSGSLDQGSRGERDKARDLLQRARDGFIRIRQNDPHHEESLRYIEKIKELLGAEARETPRRKKSDRKHDSCILHVHNHETERKIFMFSKEFVSIGKSNANEIVIPHIDYISQVHARVKVNKLGEFSIRDIGTDGKGSRNGTFLNGCKNRLAPQKDYPISDGTIINLGQSLGLFCHFFWGSGSNGTETRGHEHGITVTGEPAHTCFGIDKWGMVNAVKLKMGGITFRDEYVILLREVTVGSRSTNGVVIKGEHVSDIHARIFYRDGLYLMEDFNSLHGTFLNNVRLEAGVECLLAEGDSILIGGTRIDVELKAV